MTRRILPAHIQRGRGPHARRSAMVLPLLLIALLSSTLAHAQDADGDGVLDDGDGSGSPYDAPCPNGVTSGCDDNCRVVSNPTQADVLAPFGIGDACQSATRTEETILSNGQDIDAPR